MSGGSSRCARALAKVAFEGLCEGVLRLITHLGSDLSRTQCDILQQAASSQHTPTPQITGRTFTDELAKTSGEDRARQTGHLGQLLDRPRALRLQMNPTQTLANLRMRNGSQETLRRRRITQMQSQGLDQQGLRESIDNNGGTLLLGLRLSRRQLCRRRQPGRLLFLCRGHDEYDGKCGKERVRDGLIHIEVSTNKACRFALAAIGSFPIGTPSRFAEQLTRRHRECVGGRDEFVSIAVWQECDVPTCQPRRRQTRAP